MMKTLLFSVYLYFGLLLEGIEGVLFVNDRNTVWKDAFEYCNGTFGGADLFEYCQPQACDGSRAKSQIKELLKIGIRQYWINGYVLRSPLIVQIGCYSLKHSEAEDFHRGNFSFNDNSPFTCSRACTDNKDKYIFLMKEVCLCVSENKFISQATSYTQGPLSKCSNSCPGDDYNKCGGNSDNKEKTIYSVFEIIDRTKRSFSFQQTCLAFYLNETKKTQFVPWRCSSTQRYICETYNDTDETFKRSCDDNFTNWYDAQRRCQYKGQQLLQEQKVLGCMEIKRYYWMGHHKEEKVTWNNSSLPEDALCLKLIVRDGNYTLETDSCKTELPALCSTTDTTLVSNEMTPTLKDNSNTVGNTIVSNGTDATEKYSINTVGNTIVSNGTDPTEKYSINTTGNTIVPNGTDPTEKDSITPVIIGSAVGIGWVVVIVVIAVCLVKRRRKKINKGDNTVSATKSEYYSEPAVNYSAGEHKKMIHVTEEGVYNHLGDTENCIDPKTTGGIYDISGQAENEYDISDASGKRMETDGSLNLYGASCSNEIGLYESTKDKHETNGDESDLYNVDSNY